MKYTVEMGSDAMIYSGTSVYVHFGISPTWYTSCLDGKFCLVYDLCLEYDSRAGTCISYSPPQHHISKHFKVRLNFYLFYVLAFLFMYFGIKQCSNYFIQPHQCTI
jgi:hypothetical protein